MWWWWGIQMYDQNPKPQILYKMLARITAMTDVVGAVSSTTSTTSSPEVVSISSPEVVVTTSFPEPEVVVVVGPTVVGQLLDTDNPLNAVCMSPMRVKSNLAVPSEPATKVPVFVGSLVFVIFVMKAVPPLTLTLLSCPAQ